MFQLGPVNSLVGLAVFAFWAWMLVDCLLREPAGMEKLVWILVIIFLPLIGAVLYFVIRRQRWVR